MNAVEEQPSTKVRLRGDAEDLDLPSPVLRTMLCVARRLRHRLRVNNSGGMPLPDGLRDLSIDLSERLP